MIEVNLYSVTPGDANARVGRSVARNRFDKEGMGVSVEKFVRGFLKDNLDKFETRVSSSELVELINDSSITLSRRDVACINYYLLQSGYMLKIYNVADDEENSTGVPSGEVVEWNVIDHNFLQNDYPTATKIIPGDGLDIPEILQKIVDQSGLFEKDKFVGLKNPFTDLLDNLKKIKKVSGSVNPALTTKIYQYLDDLGIEVFCATSEN